MSDTSTAPLSSAEQMQANYEKYKDKFKDSTDELVNSETFLSLLVAEMTNQDPLEPTSNTEFVTQMAQFTSLQHTKDAASYSKSNYASSLIGKTVTAQKVEGKNVITKTGVVNSVLKSEDSYLIKIDGISFDISKVIAVSSDTGSAGTGLIGGNSLGGMITGASMMIGMNAVVKAPAGEGTEDSTSQQTVSGIIESVKVNDGKVQIVIGGTAYDIESVLEVAYPTVAGDGSEGTVPPAENSGEESTVRDVMEEMASSNLDQLMSVVDQINENERARLEDEAEEVLEKAAADAFLGEDIPDLDELI